MKNKILGLIAAIITTATAITGCGSGGCRTWGFMRNNSPDSEIESSSTQDMEKNSISDDIINSSINNNKWYNNITQPFDYNNLLMEIWCIIYL